MLFRPPDLVHLSDMALIKSNIILLGYDHIRKREISRLIKMNYTLNTNKAQEMKKTAVNPNPLFFLSIIDSVLTWPHLFVWNHRFLPYPGLFTNQPQ